MGILRVALREKRLKNILDDEIKLAGLEALVLMNWRNIRYSARFAY